MQIHKQRCLKWIKTIALFLALVIPAVRGMPALALPVHPSGMELTLIAPQDCGSDPIRAGGPVGFSILFTNTGRDTVRIPGTLALVLTDENGRRQEAAAWHTASKDSREQAVAPGGFARQAFRFRLPDDMVGTISLAALHHDTNLAMFRAAAPAAPEATAKVAQPDCPDTEENTLSTTELQQMFQRYFVNFYTYKPVYFLLGADPGIQETSFQVSFKYKPFNFYEDGFFKEYMGGLEKLYLAYTQQSFWDLKSDSAPFADSRYMPELFYYNDNLGLKFGRLIGSAFQAGFQHESNGRDGDDSRSTNYAYIQPILTFDLSNQYFLNVSPKAWIYVRNDNDTNPDLADFRGYFDLETKIGHARGLVLENHYRHGRKGGTWQFDLSYPLDRIPFLEGLLDMYLHAQFFSGYSDNLLEYNQREDVFRLGFSLVR